MPAGDVETYHSADGKWRNRIEALEDLPGAHDRKDDAVREGRARAQEAQVEHIIRKIDGTIGARSTYGHDPRNIPG